MHAVDRITRFASAKPPSSILKAYVSLKLSTFDGGVAALGDPLDHLVHGVLQDLERHVLGAGQPVLQRRHVPAAVSNTYQVTSNK